MKRIKYGLTGIGLYLFHILKLASFWKFSLLLFVEDLLAMKLGETSGFTVANLILIFSFGFILHYYVRKK